MIDRAIYASITELNFLSVKSNTKQSSSKEIQTKKKEISTQITQKKWHRNFAALIKSFTAGLFLF